MNFECDEDILLTKTVKSHLTVEEKKKMFCYSAKNDQKVVGERALKTKDIGKIWEHDAQKKCVKKSEKTLFFFFLYG